MLLLWQQHKTRHALDYKNIWCPINFMFCWNNPLTTDADSTNRAGRYFFIVCGNNKLLREKKIKTRDVFPALSRWKKRDQNHHFCTWEEYKDFGCFVVLPPTVCIFTVQRVTGVLACVGTGAVDHPQDAISLLLDRPAWTTEATGLRSSNLHAFIQKQSLEVAKVSVCINGLQH